MKKRVAIYNRVSDDDQSYYSITNQESDGHVWCAKHGHEVVDVYSDNGFSGRNFERPAFKQMIADIKKKNIDTIFISKWKRWGRNLEQSWSWIWKLYRQGVQVHCLEQPIDISQPRNKMILAIYLIEGEVDNDDRIANVIEGTRRACKMGNWVRHAPVGYLNRRDENNRPIIIPSDKAQFICNGFEMIAEGKLVIDVVRYFNEHKISACKAHTYRVLKNQAYCGKVYVSAYKNEPDEWVQGKHEPLVSAELFQKVQDILSGRKRIQVKRPSQVFPLRGVLLCPRCGKALGASQSTGEYKQRYAYYHCTSLCGERNRVEDVHELFDTMIEQIRIKGSVKQLYSAIMSDVFSTNNIDLKSELRNLNTELRAIEEKLLSVDDKFIQGHLTSEDYKRIKNRYIADQLRLNSKISELSQSGIDFDRMLKSSLERLEGISQEYKSASHEIKKQILSSVFPEKVRFEKTHLRTSRVNTLIRLIGTPSLILEDLDIKEKGRKNDPFSLCAPKETNYELFMTDLTLFSTLTSYQ